MPCCDSLLTQIAKQLVGQPPRPTPPTAAGFLQASVEAERARRTSRVRETCILGGWRVWSGEGWVEKADKGGGECYICAEVKLMCKYVKYSYE